MMESELKTLNSNPATDEGPLLKPEPDPAPANLTTLDELEKKYAAYVRHDLYGVWGMGPLPMSEKLLLGLAVLTLVPVRVVLGTIVLVLYYLICRICTAFLSPAGEDEQEDYAHMGGWRRAVILHSGRFLSRAMLFVFGFYWIKELRADNVDADSEGEYSDQSPESARAGVIVSNHVSYVDILYHMSSSFSSFVAKRSVAKLPLVGLISKCLGCVYVQRESKSSDFKGVSGIVNERIKEAHQDESAPMMMLFLEGTTTNGDYLLPFKTGAFLAKAPVLPVILRYPYQRFSPAWDSMVEQLVWFIVWLGLMTCFLEEWRIVL